MRLGGCLENSWRVAKLAPADEWLAGDAAPYRQVGVAE